MVGGDKFFIVCQGAEGSTGAGREVSYVLFEEALRTK